jgi:hypothetical protein
VAESAEEAPVKATAKKTTKKADADEKPVAKKTTKKADAEAAPKKNNQESGYRTSA